MGANCIAVTVELCGTRKQYVGTSCVASVEEDCQIHDSGTKRSRDARLADGIIHVVIDTRHVVELQHMAINWGGPAPQVLIADTSLNARELGGLNDAI